MNRMILDGTPDTTTKAAEETKSETPAATPQPHGRGRSGGAARRTIVIMLMMAFAASASMAQSMVSVTASPILLKESIAQVNAELKIIDNVSVTGIVGLGSHDGERRLVSGGQIRVYLTGGFDGGMHIGAEALYSELGKASSLEGMVNLVNGASAGPFVGYKFVLPLGLTLDLMGGFRYSEGKIETTADNTGDMKLGPLANVNVGWSF